MLKDGGFPNPLQKVKMMLGVSCNGAYIVGKIEVPSQVNNKQFSVLDNLIDISVNVQNGQSLKFTTILVVLSTFKVCLLVLIKAASCCISVTKEYVQAQQAQVLSKMLMTDEC